MTFSCQNKGIWRLYHSYLIVSHHKGLGNGWPLIFNTKEIQIQTNCKTISSRTQKWSNLLYPQLFNPKGRPIRMITQKRSAFSLPSPLSHEVLHQSEREGYGHKTGLGKAGKKKISNEWHTTPWFILLHNWRNRKEKCHTICFIVAIKKKKNRLQQYVQFFFGAEKII